MQIVNGLQTTETLYRHFAAGNKESLEKNILIKVLTSQDESIRTNIIQATNNQSNVMSYSLHATDNLQRNIEDVLRRANIYYERRDHYYKNVGVPLDRSICPLELARSFLSIVLWNPAEAALLKNKFMRNPIAYNAVFNSDMPINKWSLVAETWLAVGSIFKRDFSSEFGDISHQWKPFVAYCSIAMTIGRFDYTIKDLLKVRPEDVSENTIKGVWDCILPQVNNFKATSRNRLKKPHSAYNAVLEAIARKTGLKGAESANRRNLPRVSCVSNIPYRNIVLTDELIEKIKEALPPQPWHPGMHQSLCSSLGVRSSVVYEAVDILIDRGIVNRQKDGIVYDRNGRVIMVDPTRCKYTVSELNKAILEGSFRGLSS